MRSDAANLLARLGRKDFRYREFTDNFADMELWPIFEALLTDDRIVGKPVSALAARNMEDIMPSAARASAGVTPEYGLFEQYGTDQLASRREKQGELNAFLQRLSRDDAEETD
ncbi:hypothetical protein [Sphingobium estronivorans]|uniref:hypothetical protein n=1 Tax=Sphingobium estronivorans TaxID=1577690 RepID=UPI0012386A04|nr:hypothetical protein [Sphingobium estronivorans]